MITRPLGTRRRSRRLRVPITQALSAEAVALPTAARLLGISKSQLIRDIEAGAPVARRGARGRGHHTLVDPAAVAAWRARGSSPCPSVDVVAVSSAFPEMLSDALYQAFVQESGPHKTRLGASLPFVWYRTSTAVLDMLRARGLKVPELGSLPEKIDTLSKMTRVNE